MLALIFGYFWYSNIKIQPSAEVKRTGLIRFVFRPCMCCKAITFERQGGTRYQILRYVSNLSTKQSSRHLQKHAIGPALLDLLADGQLLVSQHYHTPCHDTSALKPSPIAIFVSATGDLGSASCRHPGSFSARSADGTRRSERRGEFCRANQSRHP